jgi:hypothetical protein
MDSKKQKAVARARPDRIVGMVKFRDWLKAWADEVGYQVLADQVEIRPDQLSNIIAGRASIGADIAARFGFACRDVRVFTPLEVKDADKTQRP